MKTLLPHIENNIKSIQKTHKLHPFYVDEMEDFIDKIDKLTNLDPTVNIMRPTGQQGTKGFAYGERFDSFWEFAFFFCIRKNVMVRL